MPGTARRMCNSAMRGTVGAMAMTGTRSLTSSLGLVDEAPPEAVLHHRASGLLEQVPKQRQPAVTELAHWAFGATAGAVYAVLPVRWRRHRWVGAVYGIVVLAGFEAGIAPVLGMPQAHQQRPLERLAFLADHALYGIVLAPPEHEHA